VVAAAQEAAAEQLVLVAPPGGGTAQSTGFSLFGAPKAPAKGSAQAGRSEQLVAGSGIGYVCIRASGLDRWAQLLVHARVWSAVILMHGGMSSVGCADVDACSASAQPANM
jgi:hypothetical protein